MEFFILVSLTALITSAFALLVAVGSALHVQTAQFHGSNERGLPPGERLDQAALAPFVGQTEVDSWWRGPTLVVVMKNTCPACLEVVAKMNRSVDELRQFRILMIERGHQDGEVTSLNATARFHALWVRDASDRSKVLFRTNVSPHAFLIEHGRVIDQHTGSEGVAFLLGQRRQLSGVPAATEA
jgi:hypothetical protein